jgi:hypothetical protein
MLGAGDQFTQQCYYQNIWNKLRNAMRFLYMCSPKLRNVRRWVVSLYVCVCGGHWWVVSVAALRVRFPAVWGVWSCLFLKQTPWDVNDATAWRWGAAHTSPSNRNLVHLLTSSVLTNPKVSLMDFPGFFCLLVCSCIQFNSIISPDWQHETVETPIQNRK